MKSIRLNSSRVFVCSLAFIFAGVLTARAAVDYIREVKPILAQNCYKCHGGSQQKGELRLDTAQSALKGGEKGPVILQGNSEKSLLISLLEGKDDSLPQMPYKKPPLGKAEIELIAKWIDEGAHAPAGEKPELATHWAFVPPHRPGLPQLKSESIRRNPIDFFIQGRLEKDQIQPSGEADKRTLLRRLSLDLIGLPPTPEEMREFLDDNSPDAWDTQVQRLLSSVHFGERWGRWWLDAARYADSNGYSIDAPRQIWKYRDWVIQALNEDMPFNEFAAEQLAGDLLPHPTIDQRIATGFNRNTQINQEGGIDPEQFRVESVMDRVSTFGTVFLGLTVGCAQCHDHKFDPISQKEYYQIFAFFNNTVQDGHGDGGPQGVLEIPSPEQTRQAEEIKRVKAELAEFLAEHSAKVTEWELKLDDAARKKLKSNVTAALKTPAEKRTLEQTRVLFGAVEPDNAEFKSKTAKLHKLEQEWKPITTLVMQELPKPRPSFVFTKGDFTRPSRQIDPGVPAILHPLHSEKKPSELTRLDLAEWLESPENPLTARVIVNRIWQQYFGRGLVETENDFGTQGSPPSNPELLDWLACEFMTPSAPGVPPWSMKHIHRLIVSSATYRQSSNTRPELANLDPNNHLLARQSRLRLDAELIRDAALEASGLLSEKVGGPPVFPPQPDGVMNLGQVKRPWNESRGADRYRRAIYTQFWRATPHPALAVFDAPDSFSACTRRLRSNTPLQALTLLNDSQFYELAKALGQRAMAQPPELRLDRLFQFCLARSPTPLERQRLTQYREQLSGESEQEQWTAMGRVLLNLDEMITRE